MTSVSIRAAGAAIVATALTTSARADLPVAERGLFPGDLTIGPAVNPQADLVIAKGETTFLMAWTDYRSQSNGSQSQQSEADVFGIRVDVNGNPVDPAPFLIAGGMGYQRRPKVAWNGENWLVMFESQDPTTPPVTYYQTRVRFARVSSQGQVLDAVPLSLPPTQFDPDTVGITVSGVGGNWLIARCIYHNDGYGTYLAGQRVSAAGQLLDPNPVMLNDWVYGPLQVFGHNGEYMVIGPDWNDGGTLKARRISANLQPLAPSFNLPPATVGIWGDGVATNGNELYVTWIANFTDLVGSRMSNTGTLLNPAGTLLFPNFSGELDITHDGTNWWLSRTVSNTASLVRVDANDVRLDPPGGVALPIVVSGSVDSLYDSHLAPRPGGGVMFSWTDYRAALGSDQNGYVMPVSPSNSGGPETCVTTSTPNQRSSELAEGPGGAAAAVFISEVANNDRVLVQLLDASGNPTSSEPVEVSRAPGMGTCGIAWNGTHYVVVWSEIGGTPNYYNIMARRLNPDGSFAEAPFTVMPGMAPSVEALNGSVCIAATRFGAYPQFIDLWVKRYDADLNPIDPPNGVAVSAGYHSGLTRTRTDGTQWLVCDHSQWTHDSSQGDAVLVRVPAAGAIPTGFNPTPYSGGSGDLDVAYSGTKYLLVWRMNSLANANNYVLGRIMNPDGTYGNAFTIAEAPGRQLRPTVTWDGAAFIVAWDDQRNQQQFYDVRSDVYAIRVSESGAVLDAQPFQIASGNTSAECTPALVSIESVTYVTTTRFETSGGLDSYRVGLSVLGVPACDSIDFNRDTLFPDTQDITDFLAVFSGAPCPTPACGDIDFNNDGLFPDTSDIDALLRVFSGGAC